MEVEKEEKLKIQQAKNIESVATFDKEFALKFLKELEDQVSEILRIANVDLYTGEITEEEYESMEFVERLWFRDQLFLKYNITEDQYL